MSEILMRLGGFSFSIDTAAYQTLSRKTAYGWVSQQRLGARPSVQYVGEGDESLTLDGIVYPHFRGGLGQIDAMRAEAMTGEPLVLVSGRNGATIGVPHGLWCITDVSEKQSNFIGGGAPLKMEFTLSLKRYGEDQI